MPSARPSAFTFSSVGPYRLYSTGELLKLPPPTWLVDNLIPSGAFVTLYAPPESFKSFAVMDLGMSIASGLAWHGRTVKGGLVLYIAGEGVGGLGKRALAWLTHHKVDVNTPDIAWLTESLPITADSEALIGLLARIESEIRRKPVLIIIDTLARCFDGEESAPEDMNRFVAGVDVLRHKFDCAVLVVHHTRLDGTRERGGTGLRAASDTMIQMERDHGTVTVSCAKQKDAEHFPPIDFQLQTVGKTGSCVLVPSRAREADEAEIITILHGLRMATWERWKTEAATQGIDERKFASITARPSVRAQIEKFNKADGLWRVRS